jgi:2-succinyl-5-enolpyruvyl-6-hydroxy-3-cyclohexene-1-carboxylate synthase
MNATMVAKTNNYCKQTVSQEGTARRQTMMIGAKQRNNSHSDCDVLVPFKKRGLRCSSSNSNNDDDGNGDGDNLLIHDALSHNHDSNSSVSVRNDNIIGIQRILQQHPHQHQLAQFKTMHMGFDSIWTMISIATAITILMFATPGTEAFSFSVCRHVHPLHPLYQQSMSRPVRALTHTSVWPRATKKASASSLSSSSSQKDAMRSSNNHNNNHQISANQNTNRHVNNNGSSSGGNNNVDKYAFLEQGGGGTFHVQELLYPHLAHRIRTRSRSRQEDEDDDDDTTSSNANVNEEQDNKGVPLSMALHNMRKVLQQLLLLEEDNSDRLTNNTNGDNNASTTCTTTTTIRIEQPLSHSVDPLLWLDAQQPKIRRSRGRSRQAARHIPSIYFANSEDTLDMAGIGHAGLLLTDNDNGHVIDDVGHVSDDGDSDGSKNNNNNSNNNNKIISTKQWDSIRTLPSSNMRVYGGGRFDAKFPHKSQEWNRFLKGDDNHGGGNANGNKNGDSFFYFLPAVELKRETAVTTATTQHSHQHQDTDTLAVTLHYGQSQEDANNAMPMYATRWEAIHAVLAVLDHLSDDTSSAMPPTLPAIVERHDDLTMDQWERSIEGIVSQAKKLNTQKTTTTTIREQEEKEATKTNANTNGEKADNANAPTEGESQEGTPLLQKCVMARSMELTLGEADVAPLDLLKKIKFGSGASSSASSASHSNHDGHHQNDKESRHLFFLCPTGDDLRAGAFVGCTPERLFKLTSGDVVYSEALAGTRLRGTDAKSDELLLNELLGSHKDMSENTLTLNYIVQVMEDLEYMGLLRKRIWGDSGDDSLVFVRRLRHLQHLCRRIERQVVVNVNTTDSEDKTNTKTNTNTNTRVDVIQQLLQRLHPTPAVGGTPLPLAFDYIRENENFDRGFFAGPFGYIGNGDADILVAIRSALIHGSGGGSGSGGGGANMNGANYDGLSVNGAKKHLSSNSLPPTATAAANFGGTKMRIFAGAGIVAGSTPQAEYMEIAHKFTVLGSLFPSSPFSLTSTSLPHANAAFSAVFVEELLRHNVVDYFICPGSRSTPLTVAIVRASRAIHRVGSLTIKSCIDERGAAFMAIGHYHRTGRMPAIITTSGTAVANLFPGIMEASVSGVPLLILTGDRPYEHVGMGMNQAVDQVKVFGNHVRWFRDIHAPTNDATIAVNSHLADASHAVSMARQLKGPVHLNIQFRENLAPEGGGGGAGSTSTAGGAGSGISSSGGELMRIRGDARKGMVQQFDASLYTDVTGWDRWAKGSRPWTQRLSLATRLRGNGGAGVDQIAVRTLVDLLRQHRRVLLVVGNVRPASDIEGEDIARTVAVIDAFATHFGIPIVASCQRVGCALRFASQAVIPYADTLLTHSLVQQTMMQSQGHGDGQGPQPLLILQIGHPLVGAVNSFIENTARNGDPRSVHVLLHDHYATERADPSMTAQYVLDIPSIDSLLSAVMSECDVDVDSDAGNSIVCSELAPLVSLGRMLQKNIIPQAISETSHSLAGGHLTEPQVIHTLAETLDLSVGGGSSSSFFWSNSMPIRDAETFFYPSSSKSMSSRTLLVETAVNRGASGIDGIVSSAQGFASSSRRSAKGSGVGHTTLVIGDVAATHDLNAFASSHKQHEGEGGASSSSSSFTTIVVNNGGGGIFSFLPIQQHGDSVGFDDYWGTPQTQSIDFTTVAKAMGMTNATSVNTVDELRKTYAHGASPQNSKGSGSNLIECQVVGREHNVHIHRTITHMAHAALDEVLLPTPTTTISGSGEASTSSQEQHLHQRQRDEDDLTMRLYYHTSTEAEGSSAEEEERQWQTRSLSRDEPFDDNTNKNETTKVMVLLHGWMGDKSDFQAVIDHMETTLSSSSSRSQPWTLIAVDLPGHGDSPMLLDLDGSDLGLAREALGLTTPSSLLDKTVHNDNDNGSSEDEDVSLNWMAKTVLRALGAVGVSHIDAVVGYSLGGRVTLAMKEWSSTSTSTTSEEESILANNDRETTRDEEEEVAATASAADTRRLLQPTTKYVLLSANPSQLLPDPSPGGAEANAGAGAPTRAWLTAQSMLDVVRTASFVSSSSQKMTTWDGFLDKWYSAPLWGNIQNRNLPEYQAMIGRRAASLAKRGADLALISACCDPSSSTSSAVKSSTSSSDDETERQRRGLFVADLNVLYISGSLDEKYARFGSRLVDEYPPDNSNTMIQVEGIANVGHTLLSEAPMDVALYISNFVAARDHDRSREEPLRSGKNNVSSRIMSSEEPPRSRSGKSNRLASPPPSPPQATLVPNRLTIVPYSIPMSTGGEPGKNNRRSGVQGIGWGQSSSSQSSSNIIKERRGLIIQVDAVATDTGRSFSGIGEVAPLPGLHQEDVDMALQQLEALEQALQQTQGSHSDQEGQGPVVGFDAKALLALDGRLKTYLAALCKTTTSSNVNATAAWLPSVTAGLEMAFLSLSSNMVGEPLSSSLSSSSLFAAKKPLRMSMSPRMQKQSSALFGGGKTLQVNGLITRSFNDAEEDDAYLQPGSLQSVLLSSRHKPPYASMKVKIGRDPRDSARQILCTLALQKQYYLRTTSNNNNGNGDLDNKPTPKVRCDANRGWTMEQAIAFVQELNDTSGTKDKYDSFLESNFEFIEEPLAKLSPDNHNISEHVQQLVEFYHATGVPFSLDETLYDLVEQHNGDWKGTRNVLLTLLPALKQGGCAALVIKPSLLGIELSWQIACLAKERFGIPTVFSSCFESGVGLSFLMRMATAYNDLASIASTDVSQAGSSQTTTMSHGLGTFDMLDGDLLSPPLVSLVNTAGIVDMAGVERLMADTTLDDIENAIDRIQIQNAPESESKFSIKEAPAMSRSSAAVTTSQESSSSSLQEDSFAASSQTKGRRIVLHAAISLPFSDKIASDKFTDLPQMPRWSPWLSSVEYIVNDESEWKLEVLGKSFKWRAKSMITRDPQGIMWESLSGLQNSGMVEFEPVTATSCSMSVVVSFLAPRAVDLIFKQGIFEDFLRNKLLKWSLEMFRDAVKGELALERGDIELGDALSEAVQGRASVLSTAIEATFSAATASNTKSSSTGSSDATDQE